MGSEKKNLQALMTILCGEKLHVLSYLTRGAAKEKNTWKRVRINVTVVIIILAMCREIINDMPLSTRYRPRLGKILLRLRRGWTSIKRRPQFLIRRRWRPTRRYRGRICVRIGRKYRRIGFRRGKPLYRVRRRWRRIIPRRKRKGRRIRRRKYRRFKRKMRRVRRYRRRKRRRIRRIRRYRRRNSPFMIYYRRKTRRIFKWKGRLTFRLGGRRRRIR